MRNLSWRIVAGSCCLLLIAVAYAWTLDWQISDTSDANLIVLRESRVLADGSVVAVGTYNSGGYQWDDLYLVKYGPNDTDKAEQIFDFPNMIVPAGNGSDFGTQLAVDESSGDIYVAGIALVSDPFIGPTRKAYLKKFSGGLEPGTHIYVGSPYLEDDSAKLGTHMDVKVHEGYVFFAVTTKSLSNGNDIKLYKFNSSMALQTGYPKTYATADDELAVDMVCYDDYVFVGGIQFGGSSDMLALRFDDDTTSPGPAWANSVDIGGAGEGPSSDTAVGIGLDYADISESGDPNVFVGGHCTNGDADPEFDFAFAKFDYADGDVLDTQRLIDDDHDDQAVGLKTSTADGSVLIAGTRRENEALNQGDRNYYVTQFSHSSLDLLEEEEFGQTDLNEFAGSFTLDDGNAPWVFGLTSESSFATADEFLVLKLTDGLDPDGVFTFDVSGWSIQPLLGTVSSSGGAAYALGTYGDGEGMNTLVAKFVD